MSWRRRHELMDLDLDAYADDADAAQRAESPPPEHRPEGVVAEQRVSVLDAAERAGVPIEELLPKL